LTSCLQKDAFNFEATVVVDLQASLPADSVLSGPACPLLPREVVLRETPGMYLLKSFESVSAMRQPRHTADPDGECDGVTCAASASHACAMEAATVLLTNYRLVVEVPQACFFSP
jgi:transposase